MNKHLKYLKYLLRHKYYVYKAGRHIGVPIIRLLIHDWTKFLPCEWLPYTNYFYNNENITEEINEKFAQAWNHHQKTNKHHWQYWLLTMDSGESVPLPMPNKYSKEMVADWIGAGHTLGYKGDVADWFAKNRKHIQLSDNTLIKVEQLIVDFGLCLV